MTPNVPPVGPTSRFERTPQPQPQPPSATPEAFGQVFDIAVARAKRAEATPPPIPPAVWEEMEAASRLFDALAAQGHELRFDAPAPREPVRAELRTVDGTVVRRVSLSEAIDFDGEPPTAA